MGLSVVIPVKDRLASLREAVSSAAEIHGVEEVVIVDDHSEPPLTMAALDLPEHAARIRILQNTDHPGAQYARLW